METKLAAHMSRTAATTKEPTFQQLLPDFNRRVKAIPSLAGVERPARTSHVNVFLIVQYYSASSAERQREIDTCLQINLLNPHIFRVCVLLEGTSGSEAAKLQQEKLRREFRDPAERMVVKTLGRRLTFSDAFSCANDFAGQAGPAVALVANADIYFDATLQWLTEGFLPPRTALALLRHGILPAV